MYLKSGGHSEGTDTNLATNEQALKGNGKGDGGELNQLVKEGGSDKFDEIYAKAPAAKIEIVGVADDIAEMFGGK